MRTPSPSKKDGKRIGTQMQSRLPHQAGVVDIPDQHDALREARELEERVETVRERLGLDALTRDATLAERRKLQVELRHRFIWKHLFNDMTVEQLQDAYEAPIQWMHEKILETFFVIRVFGQEPDSKKMATRITQYTAWAFDHEDQLGSPDLPKWLRNKAKYIRKRMLAHRKAAHVRNKKRRAERRIMRERPLHIEGNWSAGKWYGKVRINGKELPPKRGAEAMIRSSLTPSALGFAWGYDGTGPSQLAFAILLEVGLSNAEATRLHQEFKREFISSAAPNTRLVLDVDVRNWVAQRKPLDVH